MTTAMRGRVRSLSELLDGQLLLPGDTGYDQARAVWNAMVDRRPEVIVRCASSDDAAATVRFAREHDLEVAPFGQTFDKVDRPRHLEIR